MMNTSKQTTAWTASNLYHDMDFSFAVPNPNIKGSQENKEIVEAKRWYVQYYNEILQLYLLMHE